MVKSAEGCGGVVRRTGLGGFVVCPQAPDPRRPRGRRGRSTGSRGVSPPWFSQRERYRLGRRGPDAAGEEMSLLHRLSTFRGARRPKFRRRVIASRADATVAGCPLATPRQPAGRTDRASTARHPLRVLAPTSPHSATNVGHLSLAAGNGVALSLSASSNANSSSPPPSLPTPAEGAPIFMV